MARDYGGKERAFIDGLKEATGRDLAEWMAAIAAQQLPHRNDIIDWLRQQGFMFSKASWLERIHHNGGKPIYADAAAAKRRVRREPAAMSVPVASVPMTSAPSAVPTPPPQVATRPVPQPVAPPPRVAEPPAPVTPPSQAAETPAQAAQPVPAVPPAPAPAPSATSEDDLAPLLAKAKAYRPLALALIAQIKSARPTARFLVHETFISIADPQAFAHLGVSAKELRLHLALGAHAPDDLVKKGAPGAGLGKGETLSHMVVLTDARQIDRRLLDLVVRAAQNVNG